MKIEAMYVLMDGTQADPHDCAKGKDGILRHKNGVKVAIDGDGNPETVGDRAVMNSSAAGHHAEQQPRSRAKHHTSAEAPAVDWSKPPEPNASPAIGSAGVDGQQWAGSEKPQE